MNNQTIKVVTYNVDGLPETIDLKDLPWVLKPVYWVCKLFKIPTTFTINDGKDRRESMLEISKRLSEYDADIIAVQEDFNYHDELMSSLSDKYYDSTHTGEITLKNLFSNAEIWSSFPKPRLKADGLNLITKKCALTLDEEIVRWKKSYGYTSHANDKLTHKGFRFYKVYPNDHEGPINVYVLHMDADFYDPVNCPDVSKDVKARRAQLEQLADHIINTFDEGYGNPTIILGDTNSTNKYIWDVDNINAFKKRIADELPFLEVNEATCGEDDVDRVFYINDKYDDVQLKPTRAYYDNVYLSDHRPYIVEFEIEHKEEESE